jgi:hypothetical protein
MRRGRLERARIWVRRGELGEGGVGWGAGCSSGATGCAVCTLEEGLVGAGAGAGYRGERYAHPGGDEPIEPCDVVVFCLFEARGAEGQHRLEERLSLAQLRGDKGTGKGGEGTKGWRQ